MRLIDADNLKIDMEEKAFCGDGIYKIFGYSAAQVDAAPAITSPPNAPMTLEELRGMDGEPVYIKRIGSSHPDDREWALVDREHEICRTAFGCKAFFELYGKSWLAYRWPPEASANAEYAGQLLKDMRQVAAKLKEGVNNA